MPNKLSGKTIILTGSKVVQSVVQMIEEHGGQAVHFPLIETVEKIAPNDEEWLKKLPSYDWLIFTSQNAVTSFFKKCCRFGIKPTDLRHKIAAVGEKTAMLIEQEQLQVHFMPSVYSADVFVQEFQLQRQQRALFLKGSMAKSTIRDGIGADEWTVYETTSCLTHIESFKHCLLTNKNSIVIFASPSAVEVYAQQIAPTNGFVTCASIGHVTTAALATYGIVPVIQPKTYTMQAVIEQLILEEQTHD